MKIINIAAYLFTPLDNLEALRCCLKQRCIELSLKGTILLSTEGINLFLAGSAEQIDSFKAQLALDKRFEAITYKVSLSEVQPFKRLLVKIKSEIIAFGIPEAHPTKTPAPYIDPHILKQWYLEQRDFIVLDTRNLYEVEQGTFENATHLDLDHFRNFPQAVQEKLQSLPKDKAIVTVCTGGIRCEKAAPYLITQGYQQVYQLAGGILQYFEDCGADFYQGNCFVFDERETVNPQLLPATASD